MASAAFPLDEAEIVALFVESIFYGIYLVSFGMCMRVFSSAPGIRSGVNKIMFVVAIAMCVLATLDLALGLLHILDAFIWYHGAGGADAVFERLSSWNQVIRGGSYIFQTLIGDLILIFRCFIVYNRTWLIITLPFILWLGTLVCGCAAIYITAHVRVNTNLDEKHLVPFLTSVVILSMVQSLITTFLIAYRIWAIDRQMAQFCSPKRKSGLQPIVRLIVESGALYSTSLVIFLVVVLCHNNAQYAVSDAIMMIIGIVFNVIIVQVHQGRTADQEATIAIPSCSGHPLSFRSSTSQGQDVFAACGGPGGFGAHAGTAKRKLGTGTLGVKGQPVELEVSITEQVNVRRDGDSGFVESMRGEGGVEWWSGV